MTVVIAGYTIGSLGVLEFLEAKSQPLFGFADPLGETISALAHMKGWKWVAFSIGGITRRR